jgi:transcription initiation factor TFIID subunit 5
MKDQARSFLTNHKSDHSEMHSNDISRLSGIIESTHVLENELAQSWRNNRFGILMSRYPFELLLGFLQDQGFMLLLRIVNQYLNIQVTNDKLSERVGQEKTGALIGKDETLSSLVAQHPVYLGKLPPDPVFSKEVEKALADPAIPFSGELLKTYRTGLEPDPDAPSTALAVPLPPQKLLDVGKTVIELQEARQAVSLGPTTLPSVCFYTFHNTHDGLNCLSLSDDGMLISGGFADSYLKLWSLSKENNIPQKNTKNDMKIGNDSYYSARVSCQALVTSMSGKVLIAKIGQGQKEGQGGRFRIFQVITRGFILYYSLLLLRQQLASLYVYSRGRRTLITLASIKFRSSH